MGGGDGYFPHINKKDSPAGQVSQDDAKYQSPCLVAMNTFPKDNMCSTNPATTHPDQGCRTGKAEGDDIFHGNRSVLVLGFFWWSHWSSIELWLMCFLPQEHSFKCRLGIPHSLQNLLQDMGYHLLCVGVRIERDQEGTSEMQGLKITIWLFSHQSLELWSLFAFVSAEGRVPA